MGGGRVETETSKRRRDQMMSRQRCRAVTGRILASKQGQTFPNARCAREEMVPSQVATPKRPRPLLWNRVALPSCFVRGCLSWVGGSSSALALAIDLTPLVTWWPVGCSVLDLYGGLRARLRAVLRRCPPSRRRGPALLSNGADRQSFPCDVILHPRSTHHG